MEKELPKVKKSLKSFILNEDAKVIDKTTIKIALVASVIAFHSFDQIEIVNAGMRHSNSILTPSEVDERISCGKRCNIYNIKDLNNQKSDSIDVLNPTNNKMMELQGKSVASSHANHYNHHKGGHGG